MTEAQRKEEWVRWYKVSSPGYQTNALLAVLKNDGEKMLRAVLKELGLTDSAALLMEMAKREP
jgi:hypothetical protein